MCVFVRERERERGLTICICMDGFYMLGCCDYEEESLVLREREGRGVWFENWD